MSLLQEYRDARSVEASARLRRVLALRAMLADGMTQRAVAEALGVSQSAVSQQVDAGHTKDVDPSAMVTAGGPVLRALAEERGFMDLAVFGSVARAEATATSDVDLLVRPPTGTTIGHLQALQRVFETVLGRRVDLLTYGGLTPGLDDDVLREAVPL